MIVILTSLSLVLSVVVVVVVVEGVVGRGV